MPAEGSIIQENFQNDEWYLEIPKIHLKAEIAEGTDSQTLNQYIAHFAETVEENGNIGLAAHNRGYRVNYFERIKELEKDDKIFYMYHRKEKRVCCGRKRRNMGNGLEQIREYRRGKAYFDYMC